MSEPQFSLSEYLGTVQEVIRVAFDEPVWVKAEIRNLNIKGGHYYLELAEKDAETDKVIASCKATIWKFSASKIVLKFERETGIEISSDLNVLIKIRARFDPQYGFSVNIEEIDSSFTLGEIAKRYQQIIERLTQEGLIHKNKLLPTPFDIQNVLVIAPQNAAGLGDYLQLLVRVQQCGFEYQQSLYLVYQMSDEQFHQELYGLFHARCLPKWVHYVCKVGRQVHNHLNKLNHSPIRHRE